MSMTAAVDGSISLKVRNTGRVFYFLAAPSVTNALEGVERRETDTVG